MTIHQLNHTEAFHSRTVTPGTIGATDHFFYWQPLVQRVTLSISHNIHKAYYSV